MFQRDRNAGIARISTACNTKVGNLWGNTWRPRLLLLPKEQLLLGFFFQISPGCFSFVGTLHLIGKGFWKM
jgi:hypothetical protein